MNNHIVKLPPEWSKYRKLSDKAQQALQEAIEQAMKDSSEQAVIIYLRSYTDNY